MRNFLTLSCLVAAVLGWSASSPAQTVPPQTNQSQAGPVQPTLVPITAPDNEAFSIHGFADAALKNYYSTPRGLLVTNKGLTVQVLDGLVADFARSPTDTVSDISVLLGSWTDFNPGYQSGNRNTVNEFDWFASVSAQVFRDWKAGVQYVEFVSPQRAFQVERNIEFSLAFDDTAYLKPLSIQPYVKLFYAVSGSSTVVTGNQGDTFDVEIGAIPKLDLHPYSIPLILTVPSWITVGPQNFWGGDSNFGVVSTGLKLTYPLTFIPSSLGGWYADAGLQFYHMMNSRLILAQTLVGTAQAGTPGHRNFAVWSVGAGMSF